jgi:hypothetical protein
MGRGAFPMKLCAACDCKHLQAKDDMGQAAFNSQPGDGARETHSPSSADDRYRALLEVVLQQTGLAQQGEGVPEKLDSFDSLLDVARRRRGEAFACDPIGMELVETVLRKPFRAMIASDEQWRSMTAQIAQTLCDDPAAHERLRTLWRRLGERCDNAAGQ